MVQQNILSCGIRELQGIKEQLLKLDEYKTKNAKLEVEEDRLEREIAAKEKTINDEIMLTNKKRVEEIALTFDEQIDKTRSRIKKIKTKKDKLKSTKVSARIEDETASLQEMNRQLILEAKKIFKQNRIPSLCNTNLYYALFAPKGLSDLVTIIAFVIGLLIAIPFGVYQIISPKSKVLFFMFYIFCEILIAGMYILINNATKATYRDVIYKVRGMRWKRKMNRRQIKEIKHGIIKDNDESAYGLEEFDDEMREQNRKVLEITEQKKEALSVFDNTTRLVIAEEIRARHMEVLDNLKDSYNQVYNESKSYEDQIKEMSLAIANMYEMYMGKEFLTCERVDVLIHLMETRNIPTISEAMTAYLQPGNDV